MAQRGAAPAPSNSRATAHASQLNLGALASFAEAGGLYYRSSLQATNDGTVADSTLASLANVSVILDGTGTMPTTQITQLADTISVSGGPLTLSGLTNVDNATVVASGGATLTLPSGTTYAGTTTLGGNRHGQHADAGRRQLGGSTNGGSVLLIEALAGSSVTMPA